MSDLPNTDVAVQNRKFAKTCVEKKRRDRINRCLDELKDLMSQADDKARYQKMEKAEILEMAVNYMKNMKNGQVNPSESNAPAQNANQQNTYTMAFQQCLGEFQNFLNVFPGVKDDFKARIMSYMSQRYVELVASAQSSSGCPNSSQHETSKKSKSARYSPYNANNRSSPIKKLNTKISNEENSIGSTNEQSSFFYQQNSKFGGSCSSLDSFLGASAQPNSPTESEAYDSNNRSNLSSNSSPALSECSSPVSNSKKCDINASLSNSTGLNFSNFDLYQNCNMNVWRPW